MRVALFFALGRPSLKEVHDFIGAQSLYTDALGVVYGTPYVLTSMFVLLSKIKVGIVTGVICQMFMHQP